MSETGTIRSRLEGDLKQAMRERDEVARDTIRYILAGLKNAEIDKRQGFTESDAVAVLQRQAKQRVEAIEQFRAAGRMDLVAREEGQLLILKRYLPEELTDDELSALVKRVIAEVGASGQKDLGKVMPALIAAADGRADGRRLSTAARNALAGN